MTHLIIRIVLGALALLLIAKLVPGIHVSSLEVALLGALILGILNVLVKPILFILTLPVTIISLGLFSFVLNAFVFWLSAQMINGFSVDGFIPALVGSVIMTAVSTVTHKLFE